MHHHPALINSATIPACKSEKANTRSGSSATILSIFAVVNAAIRGFSRRTPGRPHGIARYADQPLILAEKIERFDGLLGETDNAARREDSHNTILAGAKPDGGLPLPAMELGRYSDAQGRAE
jgi:hypothetical protein